MVADGIYYALGFTAGGLLVSYLSRPLYGFPLFILALFCLWFFRDPERTSPPGPVAVSPADGKVVAVRAEDGGTRISIFLNVFDVHVNRSPIAGRITAVDYRKGKFLVASQEQASSENEMNTITVEGDGSRVVFKQIAGLIARRIVCWKKAGDLVDKGERIGLIKFGSRVDVWLGPEWKLAVRTGDRVAAGSSILARKGS
ncbi:MAG: phosphatidylserine decarboxylase [Bryobacteraceae bacterium]|nr:phosphatidylserine decarboxylase [Bryobacteraceae bacterium]MDW8379815.1 phosphatidylserine decarboxylase [Bryobacterales bacterium]